ncbi:hypothetical protein ACFL6B_01910 [Thermodesulfobacteriota bacterium]
MKENSRTDTLNQIIDDILSDLPLKEQVALANMSETDAEVLQQVFGLYVLRKIEGKDEEYQSVMKELWKRLQETHKLRVVK